MCSGALLHARLARVVYAVADPKTGAAGSVLDLFAQSTLNHQTLCQIFAPQDETGSDLRKQCAAILQTFFQQRRQAHSDLRQQPLHAALREDALRLPPEHFAHIAPLQALRPWSQFVLLNDPEQPAGTPWRMHVIDTAPHDRQRPAVLLLHGYASYSLLWAQIIHPLHVAGWRVMAPDLIGHGQSDKPKKAQRHQLAWHAALLRQWLAQAQFAQHTHRAVVLHDSALHLLPHLEAASAVAHPAGTLFTHTLCLQPEPNAPWRQKCLSRPRFDLDAHWALDPSEAANRYWSAPWPDAGHRAALQWPQWTSNADAASLAASAKNTRQPLAAHGTIAPTTNHRTVMTVPAGGSHFRQWLQLHAHDCLNALQAQALL